jgi:hypothetical protein
MNKWIAHVKKVQAQHGCSYKDALKIGKQTYKTGGMIRRNRDLILAPGEHVPPAQAMPVHQPVIPLGIEPAIRRTDLPLHQIPRATAQFIDPHLQREAREIIREEEDQRHIAAQMGGELFLEAGQIYGSIIAPGFEATWQRFTDDLERENLTEQEVRALPTAQRRRLLRRYFQRPTCVASGIKRKKL